MRQAWRNAWLLGGFALMVAAGALVYVTSPGSPWLGKIGAAFDEALAPLAKGALRIAGGVAGARRYFTTVARLEEERARLEKEAGRARLLEAEVEELRQENARLRALLAFRSSLGDLGGRPVAATVIARNPERWFSSVTVAAGRRQGVGQYGPVLAAGGLAGRVLRVGDDTSQVLLITDPRSGVGGRAQRDTRAAGVVLGRGGRDGLLVMRFFRNDAEVRRGDLIVTSGLGEVFPPGLPVGRVVDVFSGEGGLVRYAHLAPAADLDRLSDVLILPARSPAAGARAGRADGR